MEQLSLNGQWNGKQKLMRLKVSHSSQVQDA